MSNRSQSYSRIQQLCDIGKQLREQDNCGTDAPIYIVQQENRIYGIDDAYAMESIWVSKDEWTEVSDNEKLSYLDDAESEGRFDDLEGYERVGIRDEWEFVTAFFTDAGAREYIRENAHNLNNPRVYVGSLHRNDELRLIREFLMGLE